MAHSDVEQVPLSQDVAYAKVLLREALDEEGAPVAPGRDIVRVAALVATDECCMICDASGVAYAFDRPLLFIPSSLQYRYHNVAGTVC